MTDKKHTKRTMPNASGSECAVPVAANALIIDTAYDTVAVGERLRAAIGSASNGGAILRFIAEDDAFRFEQFVARAAPFDSLKTIRLKLSFMRGYAVAVACRTTVFARDAVLIRFYRSNDELLRSEGEIFRRASLAFDDTSSALDEAKRLIDALAADRPREARSLRAAFDELMRKSLASRLICDVVTGLGEHDPYDVISLAERAARYVGGMLGAETPFVSSPKERFSGEVDVPPEHLWYLVTAALGAAVSLSGERSAALDAKARKRSVTLRVAAKSCSLAGVLPAELALGDLRELCPRSSLRLYLCELICDANGVRSSVSCTNDELSISLTIPVSGDARTLHVADAEPRPEWLAIAEALIIPDVE